MRVLPRPFFGKPSYDEWLIELSEDGLTFAHVDSDAAAGGRDEREEGRKEELRAAILGVLPADDPDGMTREENWAALPDAVRKNEVRFRQVLEDTERAGWVREKSDGIGGAFRYKRFAVVTPAAAEVEGGKG